MPNPLVSQGTLNRIRGSIVFSNFPTMNVTAPYLSKEGIRLALQGDTVMYLPSMTGQVTSPEPYMGIEATVHMLKTQVLANLFKRQMELSSLLGDATVRSDASSLDVYQITNSAIKTVRELDFSGDNAQFVVVIGGYYLVNSSLFD
jgi:hypothetical protein